MSELAFNRVILEKNNQILMMLAVISIVINLILVFGILKAYQKPPMIVYAEDGELSILKTKALGVDEEFLKDFGKFIINQYLSFTVDSLPKQIEGLRPYLAIKPAESILASYKTNQDIIKKDNISQQFDIDSIDITKKSNPFWLEVSGTRNIHAAGNDKSVPMVYVLEIKKVKSTENNPYGLIMSDIIEKSGLDVKGHSL